MDVRMDVEPTVEWVTAVPAPVLRSVVDRYIGYRLAGFPPGVHRGLPSRHLTFISGIGNPIEVIAQTDPSQVPDTYRCVFSGLQASPALIADPGHQEGIGIELTPLGARVLFGMPARELWDTSIEFADVAGPVGDELWERLQPTSSWDDRFRVCDDVLLRLVALTDRAGRASPAGRPVAPELARAWRQLVASGGTVTVHDLARDTHALAEHARAAGEPAWLQQCRTSALATYANTEPPRWNRTDLSQLQLDAVVPASDASATAVQWDPTLAQQGVVFTTLKAAK